MGGFYSYDEVGIFFNSGGAEFRVHFIQASFEATSHAICDDIQESQHSHFGVVDDFLLFLQKGLCTCRARIHDRGDSRLQRHIGRNSQGQRMRSRFRSEPVEWGSSMANVVVNVN